MGVFDYDKKDHLSSTVYLFIFCICVFLVVMFETHENTKCLLLLCGILGPGNCSEKSCEWRCGNPTTGTADASSGV